MLAVNTLLYSVCRRSPQKCCPSELRNGNPGRRSRTDIRDAGQERRSGKEVGTEGRKSEIETRDRDQVDRSRMLVLGGVLERRSKMEFWDEDLEWKSKMEIGDTGLGWSLGTKCISSLNCLSSRILALLLSAYCRLEHLLSF